MGIHLNYRSPMINEVTVSADGSIKTTPTMAGVSQLKTLDPNWITGVLPDLKNQ